MFKILKHLDNMTARDPVPVTVTPRPGGNGIWCGMEDSSGIKVFVSRAKLARYLGAPYTTIVANCCRGSTWHGVRLFNIQEEDRNMYTIHKENNDE